MVVLGGAGAGGAGGVQALDGCPLGPGQKKVVKGKENAEDEGAGNDGDADTEERFDAYDHTHTHTHHTHASYDSALS